MKTPKLPPLSEKAFQANVVRAAKLLGWRVYHTHDSRRSDPGFPDLVCVHPAWGLLFIELKTDRGRVKPAQAEWLAALKRAGARAFLWRPAMWAEIEAALKGQDTGGGADDGD